MKQISPPAVHPSQQLNKRLTVFQSPTLSPVCLHIKWSSASCPESKPLVEQIGPYILEAALQIDLASPSPRWRPSSVPRSKARGYPTAHTYLKRMNSPVVLGRIIAELDLEGPDQTQEHDVQLTTSQLVASAHTCSYVREDQRRNFEGQEIHSPIPNAA